MESIIVDVRVLMLNLYLMHYERSKKVLSLFRNICHSSFGSFDHVLLFFLYCTASFILHLDALLKVCLQLQLCSYYWFLISLLLSTFYHYYAHSSLLTVFICFHFFTTERHDLISIFNDDDNNTFMHSSWRIFTFVVRWLGCFVIFVEVIVPNKKDLKYVIT